MTPFNCPNCGDSVAPALNQIKMMTCPSCGTTLMLADEQVRLAGQEGVMHDVPMLFGIGDTVGFSSGTVTEEVEIMGHARFSYGRGFWDEFWGVTADRKSRWVSVDEGDVVIQTPVSKADWPANDGSFATGDVLKVKRTDFDIVELDQAECVALRGSFDEEMHVGETYRFVNAQAGTGLLLSGEIWQGGQSWFVGDWYDPFDVTVRKGAGA